MKSPFAFVRFEEWRDARRAIEKMNGTIWNGFACQGGEIRKGQGSLKWLYAGIFNEVRPYSRYKWSLSRRVWVELMGLPIHTWSNNTFEKIVKVLDEKLVMHHNLTEGCESFSVARVLVDTFKWELIQQWLTVKCENVEFEVYTKEIGAEVALKGVPSEVEETMMKLAEDKRNISDFPRNLRRVDKRWAGRVIRVKSVLRFVEAKAHVDMENTMEDLGLVQLFDEQKKGELSTSLDTCPYPPGYGPCKEGAHVHKEMREQGAKSSYVANSDRAPKTNKLSMTIEIFDQKIHEGDIEDEAKTKQLCEEGELWEWETDMVRGENNIDQVDVSETKKNTIYRRLTKKSLGSGDDIGSEVVYVVNVDGGMLVNWCKDSLGARES
ncbi:hypothetical protein PIB30_020447 [Stylosanthes scabra]|uniref:RRM domain-containing protein n=1 Tax=Stylosanthes scabra TaxID=79078 RepID=A0ABU6UBT6_9FABA|nr:hypothetical protein [Stylosanthes scabra]